ncbi:uncharacterized protein LAESUDRAFT_622609, partial [Laetiporus sulphureus 93-53]
ITQRSAFEKVFGLLHIRNTFCRARKIWFGSLEETRARFAAYGKTDHGKWREFIK